MRVKKDEKYAVGSIIIFERIKETISDAEKTPKLLRKITSGLINFVRVNISASGRTIITRKTKICDRSYIKSIPLSDNRSGVKTIIKGSANSKKIDIPSTIFCVI